MWPVILIFGVTGLMGLYAALRPEQYTQYFLAKWQRERFEGHFDTLRWVGWVIFGGCVLAVVFALSQSIRSGILPYRGVFEELMLLVFAAAWLWWGISLLLRPDTFLRRSNVTVPRWGVKVFGPVLLVGAVAFTCLFIMKFWVLVR
jgi:hypothetical protein